MSLVKDLKLSKGEMHNLKVIPSEVFENPQSKMIFAMVKNNQVRELYDFLRNASRDFRLIRHQVDDLNRRPLDQVIHADISELIKVHPR